MPQSKRILVVEDNEDLALLLAETLEEQGHTVQVAHEGNSALEISARFQPELAILDLGLPVMDGYELARRMLSLHPDGTLCLFALSGFGRDEDRKRTREAGFARHFVKPLLPEVLTRAIEEIDTGASPPNAPDGSV